MPNIYKNAHVTIAAGTSKGCTGGLFRPQDWAGMSQLLDLPVVCKNGFGVVSIDFDTDIYERSTDANCLTSREWCFQESHLS